mgnify:CR=1 FL=1
MGPGQVGHGALVELINGGVEQGEPPVEVRRSRADDVYDQLKADIAGFQLVPGDRFSENELCERLQVSRTPVRQALVRLQQEGYVEVQFRSGWRVLPFDFEQFEQLYDLRQVLEATAVQRLCSGDARVDQALLRRLEGIWLVPEDERSQDGTEVSQWDEAFHCALVEAAGNREMARVHQQVTEQIRILRRLDFTQRPRITATYDEHGRILGAILARHCEEAQLLLRTHIEESKAEVRTITLHMLHSARQKAPATQGERDDLGSTATTDNNKPAVQHSSS